MHYTEQQWREVFTHAGAFWLYQGDPSKDHPHAELTSGKCSNGFFNSTRVTEHPTILQLCTEDLVSHLTTVGCPLNDIQRVIGPAVGAITLAHQLSLTLNKKYFDPNALQDSDNPCNPLSGYTEKEEGVQILKRFQIPKEKVIVCEDTITTGGSVEQTVSAVESAGGIVLNYILTICNRSGLTEIGGRQIICLVAPNIQSWEPTDCPYCKVRSDRLRPKANWAKLIDSRAN